MWIFHGMRLPVKEKQEVLQVCILHHFVPWTLVKMQAQKPLSISMVKTISGPDSVIMIVGLCGLIIKIVALKALEGKLGCFQLLRGF